MNDLLDEAAVHRLSEVLSYGQFIDLRPQLAFPGGQYRVISITLKGVKLQLKKEDPILVSLSQLLSVWTPGWQIDFGSVSGVLSALGYRVGRGGLSSEERRRILKKVFSAPSAGLPSIPEVREWGASRTKDRLSKMANCLASFSRNAQRQPRPPREAIDDWKSDLSWLRGEFDAEVRGIRWPSPDLDGPVF